MKTCTTCRIEKPLEAFSKNKKKKDGLNYVCRDCHNQYVRKHYDDNRGKYIAKSIFRKKAVQLFLEEYKKDKRCPYCGEADPACFDFHHRNPEEKDFNVASAKIHGLSLETLRKEIDKCVLLCSNCHRKHHAGRLIL